MQKNVPLGPFTHLEQTKPIGYDQEDSKQVPVDPAPPKQP